VKQCNEELGIPIETGISVIESEYCGKDRIWYFITYPAFGFVGIKRVFPNIKKKNIDIHTFYVANCVGIRTSFWPIDPFQHFMKRVKKSKIDIELVFSGPKPPLTSYLLDEIIKDKQTPNKVNNVLKKRVIPIRFNQTCFCGEDAQFLPDGWLAPEKLGKYLEPPNYIKDIEAKRKLQEAIEQLGLEKCKELIGK